MFVAFNLWIYWTGGREKVIITLSLNISTSQIGQMPKPEIMNVCFVRKKLKNEDIWQKSWLKNNNEIVRDMDCLGYEAVRYKNWGAEWINFRHTFFYKFLEVHHNV